ncbi:hypothetical protein EDB86DRAFT_324810 [Lactarius hatsudake]|nr:hypothetical protein EDB86DRAFT_324810 [Lactarius hatsudake]
MVFVVRLWSSLSSCICRCPPPPPPLGSACCGPGLHCLAAATIVTPPLPSLHLLQLAACADTPRHGRCTELSLKAEGIPQGLQRKEEGPSPERPRWRKPGGVSASGEKKFDMTRPGYGYRPDVVLVQNVQNPHPCDGVGGFFEHNSTFISD